MCFDDSNMTVREKPEELEDGPEFSAVGPFKMAKLNPYLSGDYSKYLMHIGSSNDNSNGYMQALDMAHGVHNLAETIAMMKKALDKKNGKVVIESKDLYHNQIDL